MKKLIFIALMLSFLVGNAQQNRQQFVPNSTREQVQLYYGINPGIPSVSDLNKDRIRKTDNHPGYPIFTDQDRYSIAKPDNHPGFPIFTDQDRYSIAKPDYHTDFPIFTDQDRYTIKKPY